MNLSRLTLTTAGLLAGLTGAALVRHQVTRSDPPPSAPAAPAIGTPATIDPVAASRSRAWGRTETLLADAQRQSAAAMSKHLAGIHAFVDQRKPGSRAFAERMLSLQGKWQLVKAQIVSGGQEEYASFLDEAFAQHLFQGEELQKAVEAAVRGYLAELEGIESNLLVRLRADLSEDELPLHTVIPALRSDAALTNHYQQLAQRLARDLRTDLVFVASRELFLWQATNIVTDLTMKAGAAVAARLGISSSLLAGGAASSWTTLGVGLVAAFVLDAAINQIMKAAGYDAEVRVAERINQTLDDLARTITDGSAEARATLATLKSMQTSDPDAEVRHACKEAIARIEAGTQLYGLRRELTKIDAARASLRKEALRHLIHDTEVTP